MHRAALVGERVVILAARQIEQIAGLHVHVHDLGALGLLVVLAAERLEQRVRDRVVRPALVDVPGLGALDVHGIHVVGVEVGAEARAPARRQVKVALDLAAERPLHRVGERGQPGAQVVDVVGHQGRAALQIVLDLVRVGAQHLAAVAVDLGGAVARRRDRLLVEQQLERVVRPDGRLAEQIVQPGPGHHGRELVGGALEMQRLLAFVLGEEPLGAERRHDRIETERRLEHGPDPPRRRGR